MEETYFLIIPKTEIEIGSTHRKSDPRMPHYPEKGVLRKSTHLPSIHPVPTAEKWDPKSAPPRIYVFRKLLHLYYRCHRNTHQHLFFDLTLPEFSTAATRIPTDIFDLALPESTHQMINERLKNAQN